YHCSKKGHHFRVSKKDFNTKIQEFVQGIHFAPEYINDLLEAVKQEWEIRQKEINREQDTIHEKVLALQNQAKAIVEKIKVLSSPTAIKFMEEDLTNVESQIKQFEQNTTQKTEETLNVDGVVALSKYFLENMEFLLLGSPDPIRR